MGVAQFDGDDVVDQIFDRLAFPDIARRTQECGMTGEQRAPSGGRVLDSVDEFLGGQCGHGVPPSPDWRIRPILRLPGDGVATTSFVIGAVRWPPFGAVQFAPGISDDEGGVSRSRRCEYESERIV